MKGHGRLDGSRQSKIMVRAFPTAAERKGDLLSQRTTEALRYQKAQGYQTRRPKGPGKRKLAAFRPAIESLPANGSTQKLLAGRDKTTEAPLPHGLPKQGLKPAALQPFVSMKQK